MRAAASELYEMQLIALFRRNRERLADEDVEMRDADIETEMGAAAVAEVIERMQIDDKDDANSLPSL